MIFLIVLSQYFTLAGTPSRRLYFRHDNCNLFFILYLTLLKCLYLNEICGKATQCQMFLNTTKSK